jgi:uncharacterized protein
MAMLFILVENMAIYSGQTWDLGQMARPAERATLIAILFLFQAKSYSLLAFLFGWGVGVQQERIEAQGRRFGPFYLRRLGFLLVVGLIHGTLVWSGDVLLLYAVLGLALVAFRRSCSRTILVAAAVCLSVTLLVNLPGVGMDAARGWYAQATAFLRYERTPASVYATGPLSEIARRRVQDLMHGYSWAGYYAGTVLGMFLLGTYAARRRWLRSIEKHRRATRQVMWLSLGLGLVLNELYVETHLGPLGLPQAYMRTFQVATRTTGALALVAFYVTAASLLMRREGVRRRLQLLGDVGRSSLSNYLLQSLVCTTVFYSYGLGLYGQVGIVPSTLTAAVVFLGELRLSAWWLEHYTLGPVEWLWRVAAYGRSQLLPSQRAASAALSRARVWLRWVVGRVDRRVLYGGAALLVLVGTGLGAWQARNRPVEVVVQAREPFIRVTATPVSRTDAVGAEVATPAVRPVAYAPGPIASTGNLAALASTFDAMSALKEIQVLTGPPYLGRYAASAGGRAAAEHIARRFAEYGLQPAGDDGTYFQPFPVEYVALEQEPSLVVRTAGGVRTRYRPYRNFAPMAKQYAGEGEARGGVVWGNQCAPDDLSAVDVVGKIVLCRDGPPLELQRSALEYGAKGLLLITDPAQRPPDFRVTFGEAWVPMPLVAFRVYPSVVDGLLVGSGHTVEELSSSLAPFPLAVEAEAHLSTAGAEVCPAEGCVARNVLGVLPGRDVEHRHEVVIVGAHYDHLGESPNGTRWVGANDNASGVAALLEIARVWSAEGYVPRRTVLFAAWDAEEMGLLGSQHYVDHPRYPLVDTLAMLQLDMVGAGGEVLQIDGDAGMSERLRAIAEARGIDTVQTQAGRSDHVPFWQAGIPASLLIWASGPEATPDYHRPTDTAEVIVAGRLQSVGEVAGIGLLGLAEGELGIADMLAQRAAAAEEGDLVAFLATSAARQRRDDQYWYDDLRSLSPTWVQMEAKRVRVSGETAAASVQIVVTYPDESTGDEKTLTASLGTRFQYEEGAWRWAGPDLVESKGTAGEFTIWHPGDLGEDLEALGITAAARYAQIAAHLGLPVETEGEITLLPNSKALQAATALGDTFEDGVWVGPGGVRMVYTTQISGSVRLDDALVQLALTKAGVPTDAAPWLWRGLPLLMRSQLGHAAPRFLGEIQDTLSSAPDAESEAMAWAAVAYLRDKAGWSGLGRFIAQLGRTCAGVGCGEHETDAALAGILDLGGTSFSEAWQGYWAENLERMRAALEGVLSARVDAILAGEQTAFLATVDAGVPGLTDEQAAWFTDLAGLEPTDASLIGRLLAVQDGRLLVLVDARWWWGGAKEASASPNLAFQTVVAFRPSPEGYKWSGPPCGSLTGGLVTLLFSEGMGPQARTLHEAAGTAYVELNAALGLGAPQPLVIKLYESHEAFLAAIPPSFASSATPSAWTGKEAPVQLLVAANADVKQYRSALTVQLARHLLRQQGVDAEWLLKGIGLYLASRLDPTIAQPAASQMGAVLRAAQEDALTDLWNMPPDHALTAEALSLAEAQVWDTVCYLADRYGEDVLRTLVRTLGSGLDADAALRSAVERGSSHLYREWAASLARGHARREWEAVALQFDPERTYEDVAYLSSRRLEGRQAGSAGAATAAAHIVSRFAEYGLQPAVIADGVASFEQRFPISYTALLQAPVLEFVGEKGDVLEALAYRVDFIDLLHETSGSGQAEGEAVWIADPSYAGIELGGRVAVRVASLPIEAEVTRAMEHGASALAVVGKTAGRKRPLAKPALPVVFGGETPIPVLGLTQQGYEQLLSWAGQDRAGLRDVPPALPLGVRVRLRIALEAPKTVEATNILGLLPGSDPALAEEVVLVSAHYDHVGDDPPAWICPRGVSAVADARETTCRRQAGTRYPGANDNATGVAVMLEIARLWHEEGYRPRRTVLFAAWAAQEAGQVGLRRYVQAPAVSLENLVAVLHLEAVGGGEGYYLGAEGDRVQDGLLRFTMERAEEVLDGRLSVSSPPTRDDPVVLFREAGIPTLRLRWREASEENWPIEYADEVQPYRLGVTGRMVTLALMALAR